MATYALGKVGLKLCGNYDASATYNMLDVVTYGGSCYAALQSCTGVPVTNTEYWQMLCAGNAESYSTDEVCTGGIWVDGKPIYRKTVQFNSLTNGSNNYMEIGASGTIDTVVKYYGIGWKTDKNYIWQIPHFDVLNTYAIKVEIINRDTPQIMIAPGSEREIGGAFVIVEYTKV